MLETTTLQSTDFGARIGLSLIAFTLIVTIGLAGFMQVHSRHSTAAISSSYAQAISIEPTTSGLKATQVKLASISFWGHEFYYFKCILGVGVPIGAAWALVDYLGVGGLLAYLTGRAPRVRAGGPPIVSRIATAYAHQIWNSCRQYMSSY